MSDSSTPETFACNPNIQATYTNIRRHCTFGCQMQPVAQKRAPVRLLLHQRPQIQHRHLNQLPHFHATRGVHTGSLVGSFQDSRRVLAVPMFVFDRRGHCWSLLVIVGGCWSFIALNCYNHSMSTTNRVTIVFSRSRLPLTPTLTPNPP